ncbi:MAG: 4Fe-4S binding protein [Planctomycetes bacterium]|nr:4Fe-4S binding protein [Planctomycetota bacterium]
MADSPNLSRRDLLRGKFRAGEPTAPQQTPAPDPQPSARIGRRFALPIHRPPGAVPEAAFLSGCTRCNKCIEVCPVGAIVHAPERFREAAGTPMIDPYSAACVMCTDTPCIAACEPSVLQAQRPKKMGVAWVQHMACLAYTGSFCTVCSERCPVEGAIEVKLGKPRIREDICTGCGVCASVCPAPSNAIIVMPLADRP